MSLILYELTPGRRTAPGAAESVDLCPDLARNIHVRKCKGRRQKRQGDAASPGSRVRSRDQGEEVGFRGFRGW